MEPGGLLMEPSVPPPTAMDEGLMEPSVPPPVDQEGAAPSQSTGSRSGEATESMPACSDALQGRVAEPAPALAPAPRHPANGGGGGTGGPPAAPSGAEQGEQRAAPSIGPQPTTEPTQVPPRN